MTREEFNKMSIGEKVRYFNEELKREDNNFNAICKRIGISKNTILSNFRNNGYEAARKGQKIIYFYKEENNKLVVPGDKKIKEDNGAVAPESKKVKEVINDPEIIRVILNRIELLEKEIEELKNKKGANNRIDFIKTYDVTTTKTFKIDVNVNNELEKVFEKYKMYKKQDIVTTLIKIGLESIE